MKKYKILAINGSYRQNGIIDQSLSALKTYLEDEFELEVINLRDYEIDFCTNCRSCTQEAGKKPGKCVLNDSMESIINKIEKADGYIFASPTNFFTITALYKRFLERLVVYGYWPWGVAGAEYRKEELTKKAILINSTAMPSLFSKFFTNTIKILSISAKVVGAKVVEKVYIGMIATQKNQQISFRNKKRLRSAVIKLMESLSEEKKPLLIKLKEAILNFKKN